MGSLEPSVDSQIRIALPPESWTAFMSVAMAPESNETTSLAYLIQARFIPDTKICFPVVGRVIRVPAAKPPPDEMPAKSARANKIFFMGESPEWGIRLGTGRQRPFSSPEYTASLSTTTDTFCALLHLVYYCSMPTRPSGPLQKLRELARLSEDTKLPTVRALAAAWGITTRSVHEAIREGV